MADNNKIRIAIFDNNQKFRESLEFLIVTSNDIELCGSFDDISRLIKKVEVLLPDVVLIDVNIPGKNRLETLLQIKMSLPGVNICLQTTLEIEDQIFIYLCHGASGYIIKNTSPEKVLQSIREVAVGGSFFSTSVAKKILLEFQKLPKRENYLLLTMEETEILFLISNGMSPIQIAQKVLISFNTVYSNIKRIYEKLHKNTITEYEAK
jgi:DNA-binding NarL/FixJ family response regulator